MSGDCLNDIKDIVQEFDDTCTTDVDKCVILTRRVRICHGKLEKQLSSLLNDNTDQSEDYFIQVSGIKILTNVVTNIIIELESRIGQRSFKIVQDPTKFK